MFGTATSNAGGFGSGPTSGFGGGLSTAPSFGSSSASAPTFGGNNTGTSGFGSATGQGVGGFGGNAATTPGLGGGSTTTSGFGSATSQGAGGFGSSSTPAAGFGSGTATTAGFAAPATSSQALPSFGSLTSIAPATSGVSTGFSSSGLGFGSTTSGATTSNTPRPGFGSSALSAPAAGTTDTASYQRTTRVADLPDASTKLLEEFETFQRSQLQIRDELAVREAPELIRHTTTRLHALHQQRTALEYALGADGQRLDRLKHKVNSELRAIEAASRGLGDLSSLRYPSSTLAPSQGSGVTSPAAHLTFDYYWGLLGTFETRYQEYTQLANQIESHLASVLRTMPGRVATSQYLADAPAKQPTTSLTNALRYMHETFMSLSSQIASIHSQIEDLRMSLGYFPATH
ncbi:hypothetical protein IWQ60_001495 [Tieghemiomyces parasiticus]|uniref:Uncharacterized protein n=1 Tax=Tieghemiomyces parasiticus TaxID=78921 RepID=A0A9W8ADV5_9FUNG|nr:hypothetical protein IWQ60_001495 [Tieghemiomyces parasiticus]